MSFALPVLLANLILFTVFVLIGHVGYGTWKPWRWKDDDDTTHHRRRDSRRHRHV